MFAILTYKSDTVQKCVIALSHIHVSTAYSSRIYENFDMPRSEPYFVRATYVPHTCDVPATFPWRISDVSLFHFRMYGVSRRMYNVRVTYLRRMYTTFHSCLRRICYVPIAF